MNATRSEEVRLQPTADAIDASRRLIAEYMDPGPIRQLPAFSEETGADVAVKIEFLTPVGSFKLRGALTLVDHLRRQSETERIVTCSTGNHGSAMAYACRLFGLPITVGVPVNCDRRKAELIREFGADLEFAGRDLDETKDLLREQAEAEGAIFIEDGSSPEVVAGTATIGAEILEMAPDVETVIVPIGNGALIGGIGTAIRYGRPDVRIVGVQAEAAPCMALSFEARRPVDTEHCETFAGGVAVRVAIPEAVELVNAVTDEVLLVSDDEMKVAMADFHRQTSHLPEGAGAAALAALMRYRERFEGEKVCLVATGANVDPALEKEVLTYAG
jgi:threonine dehydratase